MGLFNWILDAVLLTLSLIAAVVPIVIAAQAYQFQRARLSVWDDRAPWLGPAIGAVNVLIVLAIAFAVYAGGYYLVGFPRFMGWIFG